MYNWNNYFEGLKRIEYVSYWLDFDISFYTSNFSCFTLKNHIMPNHDVDKIKVEVKTCTNL